MVARPGTIPALTPYQPAALLITGNELVEIASSDNATAAISGSMLITDVVGKAPSALPQANPVGGDVFAFFQAATGLPRSCTLANFGVPAGNVAGGGTAGQLYKKNSATNFDAGWSGITSFIAVGATLATTGTATSIVIAIANGGVGSTQLAANAVQRSNLTAAAVGSSQLDIGAVLRANLTAVAIGSTQIDVGAVLRTNLTAAAVGSSQIDVAAIGSTQLSSAALVGGNLFGATFVQFNNGTVSSGTATISVANGDKQRLTVGGAITAAFSNWPSSGVYAEVEIELINGGTNVTWPTVHWLKGDGTNSTTFSTMGVTLNVSGTNFIIVWSRDGGTTIWGRAA